MSDAVAMAVVLLIGVGALLGLQHWLANAARYREEMTEEDYQESLEQGPGVLGAGMMAIDQQLFHRGAERAIEYRIDGENGQLPGSGGQGESLAEESEKDKQDIKQ